MKDYIKGYQQGGSIKKEDLQGDDDNQQLFSMDAHRANLPIAKRSTTTMPHTPVQAQILKNFLTGDAVGANDRASNVPGTPGPVVRTDNTATVQAYQKPSLRERVKGAMDNLNRGGKNEIAKAFTAPMTSAMNLLRADKYFDGATNDDAIGSGVLRMGGDVLNVAGAVGGAKSILGVIPEATPEVNQLRMQWMAENGDVNKALQMQYDPRTIGERTVDAAHDVYAPNYKRAGALVDPSGILNGGRLGGLRQNYINNKYTYDAPMTPENLEGFAQQNGKLYMKGDGMIAGKVASPPKDALATHYGDGKLFADVKSRLFPQTNAPTGTYTAAPTEYSLFNDPAVSGGNVNFRANLNIPDKLISNYGYVSAGTDRASLAGAGRFTKTFEENAPVGYTYDPGSLSGDSFTTMSAGARRSADKYVPTDFGQDSHFGKWNGFNELGKNSGLSKMLSDGDGPGALSASRKMNDQNLSRMGVPDDTRELMMNYFDEVGVPGYFSTPVRKIVPGEAGEPMDWSGVNNRVSKKLNMMREHTHTNGQSLDDLYGGLDFEGLGEDHTGQPDIHSPTSNHPHSMLSTINRATAPDELDAYEGTVQENHDVLDPVDRIVLNSAIRMRRGMLSGDITQDMLNSAGAGINARVSAARSAAANVPIRTPVSFTGSSGNTASTSGEALGGGSAMADREFRSRMSSIMNSNTEAELDGHGGAIGHLAQPQQRALRQAIDHRRSRIRIQGRDSEFDPGELY